VRLNFYREAGNRRVPVIIRLNVDRLQGQLGVLEDLTNPAVLAAQVRRGLRAELHSESYLIGSMFVELDYFPRAPTPPITSGTDLPVIPTIPSAAIARIQKTQDIIAGLPSIDFRGKIAEAANYLDSLRTKVSVIPFAEYHQKIVDGLAPLTRFNPGVASQRIDNFLARLDGVHDQIAAADTQFAAASQTFAAYNQADRDLLKNTDAAVVALGDDLRPAAPWLTHFTHNLQQFTADLQRLTEKTNAIEDSPGLLHKPAK